MNAPAFARTIADLRAHVAAWRAAGERVALVPTMGALHAGHIALTQHVRAHAQRVIVSIFVNPTQFAPTEDFSKYPRTFEADVEKLSAAGVDLVYAPSPEEMYPQGFSTTISLAGPALADLEDRFRPTHFAGVATVVAKLFTQAAPDVAIFGQKDYQQLAVIARMTRDLDLPVEIIGMETVREADGLALSSRNVYLSAEHRALAPMLHATMQACALRIAAGDDFESVLDEGRSAITKAGFALDYLELRNGDNLGAPAGAQKLRLLLAARIGATRLIDNIDVPIDIPIARRA
jgi:pantoate--beta-alanine ligase